MFIKNYYCPTCNKFLRWYQVQCMGEDDVGCWIECKKCENKIISTKDLLMSAVSHISAINNESEEIKYEI